MTEELMNQNTDLKDLFVKQDYEGMIEVLDALPKEEVAELTMYNYEIIQKYYDTEKYDLIKQYITFVAFSCFLFEYAAKSGLLTEEEFERMNTLFTNIFEIVKR